MKQSIYTHTHTKKKMLQSKDGLGKEGGHHAYVDEGISVYPSYQYGLAGTVF